MQNQSQIVKRKRNRQPNASKMSQTQLYNKLNSVRIPKSLQASAPFPADMYRKLTFIDTGTLSSLTTYAVREYQANSAYDPDPVIGGRTCSGFTQLAAVYTLYRVEHIRFKISVVSNEPAKGVSVGVILRDVQPSLTIGSLDDALNAIESAPSTGVVSVGQTTGMSIWNSRWYEIPAGTVVGNQISYMADHDYAAIVTASPAQLIYLAIVVYGAGGLSVTNGILYTITMELGTRFYSLRGTLA